MLKFFVDSLKTMWPTSDMPGEQAISHALAELKQEDTRFSDRFERAMLIIQSDQEVFGKYSGYVCEQFDRAAALYRLVDYARMERRGLKEGLRLQVDQVVETGRRFACKRDVEAARESNGWMIGLGL